MLAALKITDIFRRIATEYPARYLQPFKSRGVSEEVKNKTGK